MIARFKKYLPLREWAVAIGSCSAWFVIFGATGYPVDDWLLSSLLLYVSLFLSRAVVTSLASFALGRLTSYHGLTVLSAGEASGLRDRLTLLAPASAALAIVGLSVGAGMLVIGLYGGEPLPAYFGWAAWALLAAGVGGLCAVVGGLARQVASSRSSGREYDAATVGRIDAVSRSVAVLEVPIGFG